MPGNYGPPFPRLECVQRSGDEIVYRDTRAVRIGSVFKAAIYCAVAGGWIYGAVSLLREWGGFGARLGGFAIFNLLFVGAGLIFLGSMLPSLLRETREAWTRRKWHLYPREHRADFCQTPPFRPTQSESLTGARRVILENKPWPGRQERHWLVWLTLADGRTLCVDHGGDETGLRTLGADFAETFALPLDAPSGQKTP